MRTHTHTSTNILTCKLNAEEVREKLHFTISSSEDQSEEKRMGNNISMPDFYPFSGLALGFILIYILKEYIIVRPKIGIPFLVSRKHKSFTWWQLATCNVLAKTGFK